MFSWFVPLRQRAAQMHRDGSLMCMPVLLSASTVAAASSFEGTSRSKVKDLHLPLLPKERAWSMVREFLGRVPNRPGELPMDCPDKIAQIFDWAGGNPRRIAWGLSAMSGSVPVNEERLLTGGHLVHTCIVSLALCCTSMCFDHHLQSMVLITTGRKARHACASCATP
jgi:hypothetical protein